MGKKPISVNNSRHEAYGTRCLSCGEEIKVGEKVSQIGDRFMHSPDICEQKVRDSARRIHDPRDLELIEWLALDRKNPELENE